MDLSLISRFIIIYRYQVLKIVRVTVVRIEYKTAIQQKALYY